MKKIDFVTKNVHTENVLISWMRFYSIIIYKHNFVSCSHDIKTLHIQTIILLQILMNQHKGTYLNLTVVISL